jgi:hypothetical protein
MSVPAHISPSERIGWAAYEAMMKSPVDAPRARLSDQVRLTPSRLAKLRKYGCSPEFRAPCILTVALPTYADWLKSAMRPRVLRPDPPRIPDPRFSLADPSEYIAEFDRLNGLKG